MGSLLFLMCLTHCPAHDRVTVAGGRLDDIRRNQKRIKRQQRTVKDTPGVNFVEEAGS